MQATVLSGPQVHIAADYLTLCEQVASRIAGIVRSKPNAVLGLATGATPVGVYRLLAEMHRSEGLDFSGVTTFNLDEYYPMSPDSPHSYHRFMDEQLFAHINCRRWNVPDGRERGMDEIEADCRRYEQAIHDAGGIDLQILGIGQTGHIGFNEPGSDAATRTRLVTLDPVTRENAAEGFGGIEHVPHRAISMGVATILDSREIVLMATGRGKADIVQRTLSGPVTSAVPATLLKRHTNTHFWLDTDAAHFLDR